jgi:dihydroorotate dehydrogenase
MDTYRHIVRPLAFRMSPQRAHATAKRVLAAAPLWAWGIPRRASVDARLRTTVAGIDVRNPIGLAAGFDKDCDVLGGLARLGFGYIVAGSVLRSERAGNPEPHTYRLLDRHGLLSAPGLPSKGVDHAIRRLRRGRPDTPLFISIAGREIDEYTDLMEWLQPHCDGLEVNISCPNTQGRFEAFGEPAAFSELLGRLIDRRTKPLFVKLPAAYDDETRGRVLELVDRCLALGVDGVTAGNSPRVADARLSTGEGGMCGPFLFPDTLKTVSAIRARAGDGLVVNACGGVTTGEDAFRLLRAGATTVQVMTSFVYRGPAVVEQIARELLLLEEGTVGLDSASSRL